MARVVTLAIGFHVRELPKAWQAWIPKRASPIAQTWDEYNRTASVALAWQRKTYLRLIRKRSPLRAIISLDAEDCYIGLQVMQIQFKDEQELGLTLSKTRAKFGEARKHLKAAGFAAEPGLILNFLDKE